MAARREESKMTVFEERGKRVEGGAADVPAVEYTTGWGERVRLVICSDVYECGGGLALLALDATNPDDEEYLDIWNVLTVNLPDDPVAAAWCSEPGRVVMDANNVSPALVRALADEGLIELAGRSVRSGYCLYPLATVPDRVLAGLKGCGETVRELAGDAG